MHPVSAILDFLVLYRYSMVLALAAAAGICFFMACCTHLQIQSHIAAGTALTAVLLSLFLSRAVYWYGRPNQFTSFFQALLSSSTECYALTGAFAGCLLAAITAGKQAGSRKILDCMCVAGCLAMALGRLGCFFSEADRGQVMTRLTELPWAYPVTDIAGNLEYRFATFLFQAAFAAVLGAFLTVVFLRKKSRDGDVTLLFMLCYSASQILLDSTRYDSLYLRSNGFISIVQVLSLIALASVLILLSVRNVKHLGSQKWMIVLWSLLLILLGSTGYMEYYVQRHGREAAFSYSIMGICLAVTVALGIRLWRNSLAEMNH